MRRLASRAVEKTPIRTKLIFPSVNILFQVQIEYYEMEEDEPIQRGGGEGEEEVEEEEEAGAKRMLEL